MASLTLKAILTGLPRATRRVEPVSREAWKIDKALSRRPEEASDNTDDTTARQGRLSDAT
jgi:hypothetical protein